MLELMQSVVKLTKLFGIWIILLTVLVVFIIFGISWTKKQCKRIREEKEIDKLEGERDKIEAINAVFTGIYLTTLFWIMKDIKNIWGGILYVLALALLFEIVISFQIILYFYKKEIRERNKKSKQEQGEVKTKE